MLSKEMQKLRDLLDEKGIEWTDLSEDSDDKDLFWMERTRFKNKLGEEVSVIHGYGSYGGYKPFEKEDEGLLEALNLDTDDQDGYLTADKVLEEFY